MKKKNNENQKNITKYGEQVCSEFAWITLDKQKENASKFSKMTNSKSSKSNKKI